MFRRLWHNTDAMAAFIIGGCFVGILAALCSGSGQWTVCFILAGSCSICIYAYHHYHQANARDSHLKFKDECIARMQKDLEKERLMHRLFGTLSSTHERNAL